MVRSAAANMLGSRLACQQPCPLARRSEAPTVSDPEAPATAGPAEAGGRGRDDSDERRFRDEEERAIASLAGWIGHPAIPAIVRDATASVTAAIAPVARHLSEQREVIPFCWGAFGIMPVEPGWTLRGHTWLLTPAERAAIEPARATLAGIAGEVADALASAGVPLDPGWPGDLAVIAEILVLEAIGIAIPWELAPRGLADGLQPPPNSAIQIDARGTEHRRGISERAERNAGALRRSYEQQLHGIQPPAPYAGGGKRATPRPTVQRRAALRAVLAAFPEATASRIRATYQGRALRPGGAPATPGGYLRHLLGGQQPCPSKTTLTADLNALGSENPDETGGEEIPSG